MLIHYFPKLRSAHIMCIVRPRKVALFGGHAREGENQVFSSLCIFPYNIGLYRGQGLEAQWRSTAVVGSGCVQPLSFLSYSPVAVQAQLHTL